MAQDERQILNLLSRYMELVDAAEKEQVAELFRHATVRARAGGQENVMVGYDEFLVSKAGERVYEDGTLKTKHLLTNTILDIDGELAYARSYYTVLQATDELPLQPIICGRYHDTFEKVEGAWRFKERIFFADLVGNMSQHLDNSPV